MLCGYDARILHMLKLPIWAGMALLGALLFLPVARGGEITLEGRQVTADTKRFRAVFEGPVLLQLENKLTGEVYATPVEGDSPAAVELREHAGIAIESLRPGVPVKYYSLGEKTAVASEPVAGGLRVTFSGLQTGSGEAKEFAPAMKLAITYAVDAESGELVVTPEAFGNIEKIFDIQDRGVYRSAIRVGGLADELRLVLPSDHGVSFTAGDVPAEWSQVPVLLPWPKLWEAGLLIAEGKKGSFALWAEEPTLRYGRWLSLGRAAKGWQAAFEFEAMEMNYRSSEITGASWRLNVFPGGWLEPARRYQAQMRKWWPELRDLKEQKPAWVDSLRLVLEPSLPSEAEMKGPLAALPRESIAVFCREGWRYADTVGTRTAATVENTLWPVSIPWDFTQPVDLKERIAAVEAKGIRVFPFAGVTLTSGSWQAKPNAAADSVYTPEKELARPAALQYLASPRLWARLYPEACRMYAGQLGGSGISEDRSWVMRRFIGDEPVGTTWFTGSVRMRRYLRELLPETALMGDQVNEVTCRGQQLSRAITRFPRHAHPLSVFLFEPFTRQWSASVRPEVNEADDIHGFLPGWLSDDSLLVPELRELLRLRGELFAREGLLSFWPEALPENVLHVYKSKDGAEYRLIRDGGTALVKVGAEGAAPLYRRIGGVSSAVVKGGAIPQWLAYDGDRAIGLNPQAVYIPKQGAARPEIVISALPEGVMITRTLSANGYWLVDLQTADGKPATGTVRVTTSKNVLFCGAKNSKPAAGGYELTLGLPGTLCAYWGKPVSGYELYTQMPELSIFSFPAGLKLREGKVERKEKALLPPAGVPEYGDVVSMSWLLDVPADAPWFFCKFGTGEKVVNSGVEYRVLVNGKPMWTRVRKEVEIPYPGATAKTNPVKYGGINMSDYAGSVVVLELVTAADGTAANNEAVWNGPQFVETPLTFNAEFDKPVDALKPKASMNLLEE